MLGAGAGPKGKQQARQQPRQQQQDRGLKRPRGKPRGGGLRLSKRKALGEWVRACVGGWGCACGCVWECKGMGVGMYVWVCV